MCFSKRACTDGNIFDPHIVDFLHNHVYDQISITEMMVETKCHTIVSATFYKGFVDGTYHFAGIMVHHYFCNGTLFLKFCVIFVIISLKISFRFSMFPDVLCASMMP